MNTYQIDIQNPNDGSVETRNYTMVSTTSLRSRTASLRFQKAMLDMKLFRDVALTEDSTDIEKSENYDTALQMLDMQNSAYEDLCKSILVGDWSNVDYTLIDETVIQSILTDFFSSANGKINESDS